MPLLTERGASYRTAAIGLGLIGVGQVAGRLGFVFIPKRWGPTGRLVIIIGAAAAALLALALLPGPLWLLLAFGIVIGMARGCHTLVQATAVADRWGTRRFGTINGVFSAPLLVASALAPTVGTALGGAIGFGATATAMAALVGAAALLGSRT